MKANSLIRKLLIITTSIFLMVGVILPNSFYTLKADEETKAADSIKEYLIEDEVTVDNVTIRVSGLFNEEGHLSVERIDNETNLSNDRTVLSYSYDIKVLNENDEELEPLDNVNVSFVFDEINENLNPEVFHEEEPLEVNVEDNTLTVETDSFSIYTVEFTYEDKQYVLDGDSSVELNTILDSVGLTGNIENAYTSNSDLVEVIEDNSVLYVKSKVPFTTEEILTVIIDGIKYEIKLTDAIAGGNFGTGLEWSLSDGLLTIKPTVEQGILPAPDNSWGSNAPSYANLSAVWPWLGDAYRNQITSIKIEEKVSAPNNRKEVRYMFYSLTNLETVDLSGLDLNTIEVFNDMFKNCSSLKEIELGNDFYPKQMNRMFSGCTKLEKVSIGSLESPFNASRLSNYNDVFNDCSNLTELNLPGVSTNSALVTIINNRFANANNKMKTLNIPGAQIFNRDGRTMFNFNNDTLQTLNMPDATVDETNLRTFFHNFNADTIEISNYNACQKLKTINMENVTFNGGSPFSMFRGLEGLEKVNLKNAKFLYASNFNQMFQDCTKLIRVDMSGDDFDVKDAERMAKMFMNCSSLESLDVSGFGKLEKIYDMNDFVAKDYALVTLNMDNLDNSIIGPTNNRHSLADYTTEEKEKGIPTRVGAKEYGREIFGINNYDIPGTFENLVTLSAKNSSIWMCKNTKGLPGQEYYTAADINDVLFFTETVTQFASDLECDVTIDSMRDYIDLLVDRDGITNHNYVGLSDDDLPDKDMNINIINGDLNGDGEFRPGKLAPGVYTITDNPWSEKHVEMDDTYYRINYIGQAPYEVKVNGEVIDREQTIVGDLVIVQATNNTYINTKLKNDWPTSGNFEMETNIVLTYKDAAIDVNGKKHNVIIEINKVTFKNLERIPTDPERGDHDSNKYYNSDGGGYYYRTILQATKENGVLFNNYLVISDPTTPWNRTTALSGGSGTDIDFTIKIDKANENTSFIFYVDDIDVAESQDWIRPVDNDPCYDYLPIENVTYGKGGEGFIINSGNLGEPKFAEHTGLVYVDQKAIVATGSDPNPSWAEFAIKTDAKDGGKYTWTSGVACTTYALKNTPKLNLGEIEFEAIKKVFNDGVLTGNDFEFELVPKDENSLTAKNDAEGNVTFGKFKYNDYVTIDDTDYYPGTSGNNTEGHGEHNKNTYEYTVKEIVPDSKDPEIIYDENTYNLKIIISTPENDEEMAKGIKADIFVDGERKNTVWTKDVKDNKYVDGVVFSNTLKTYNVSYEYEDSDNLPEEVKATIPTDDKKYKNNEEVTSKNPIETTVKVGHFTYTFEGWDETTKIVDGDNVVFVGKWSKKEDPKYGVEYKYDGDLPQEVLDTLPTDENEYYDEDVVDAKDPSVKTVKVGHITYTFEGWDETSKTVDGDKVVFTGKWSEVEDPKYPVTYEYDGDLPQEVLDTLPNDPEEYYDEDVVNAKDPSNTTIKIGHTTYKFVGWDKTTEVVDGKEVKFVGKWVASEDPTYSAIYEYEDDNLPSEVLDTLPTDDEAYFDGDEVTSKNPTSNVIRVGHATYTFAGWDKASEIVDGKDVKFVGKWNVTYDPVYIDTYVYSGELPKEVLDTLPDEFNLYYDGDTAVAKKPKETVVKVNGGKWVFEGWDKNSQVVNGADPVFTGTWKFIKDEEKKDSKSDTKYVAPKTGIE